MFVNALPPAGSAAQLREAACKARAGEIAKQRPNTSFLDLHHDNAMARKVDDYIDALHFRGDVSRMVEDELSKAVVAIQSNLK